MSPANNSSRAWAQARDLLIDVVALLSLSEAARNLDRSVRVRRTIDPSAIFNPRRLSGSGLADPIAHERAVDALRADVATRTQQWLRGLEARGLQFTDDFRLDYTNDVSDERRLRDVVMLRQAASLAVEDKAYAIRRLVNSGRLNKHEIARLDSASPVEGATWRGMLDSFLQPLAEPEGVVTTFGPRDSARMRSAVANIVLLVDEPATRNASRSTNDLGLT